MGNPIDIQTPPEGIWTPKTYLNHLVRRYLDVWVYNLLTPGPLILMNSWGLPDHRSSVATTFVAHSRVWL